MSNEASVVKLSPGGPDGVGLSRMELDSADFIAFPEEQRIHVYFEDPAIGLAVGIWTTTDMQEALGPYPGDEFMVVLEGRVEMLDDKDGAIPVETGQAFAVRNGAPLSWKQVGFLRKAFLLLSSEGDATPGDGPAVVVAPPEPGAVALADAAEMIGGGRQREATLFTNDTGNMEAGVWETTAFETEMSPFSVHEFAHVISGAVTITEDNGASQRFEAGDSLFVPAGTVCSWKAAGPVRKYFAAVTP